MMNADTMIKENVKRIRERIAEAAQKRGASPDDITVLAATKTVPPQTINELPGCGITAIGENRVQEFLSKYDELDKSFSISMIGALQTNKVKYIIDKVSLIQSLDRMSLADEIDRQAKKHNKVMDVLIEINVGGEDQKSGVSEKELNSLISYTREKENIRLKGFMSVLPIDVKQEHYKKMNEIFLREKGKDPGIEILSMGMSGDYFDAIANGSNMVRLGTVIFGSRV